MDHLLSKEKGLPKHFFVLILSPLVLFSFERPCLSINKIIDL